MSNMITQDLVSKEDFIQSRIGFLNETESTIDHNVKLKNIAEELARMEVTDEGSEEIITELAGHVKVNPKSFVDRYNEKKKLLSELPPVITAKELMKQVYPELSWIVPQIIPQEGIAILVAPPKAAKSLLCSLMSLNIASGEKIFNSIPGDSPKKVLYIDLENSHRRAQDRIRKQLQDTEAPANCQIAIEWPRIGEGGIVALEEFLKNDKDICFVIIDTWGKICRSKKGSMEYSYSGDVKDITELRTVANNHDICILLVHHTRKATSEDWLEMASGTAGFTGTADTLLYLERKRGCDSAILHCTGRDVEDVDYDLSFDTETLTWTLVGRHEGKAISKERQDIIDLLKEDVVSQSPKNIAFILRKNSNAVSKLLKNMLLDGQVINGGYGKYTVQKESEG